MARIRRAAESFGVATLVVICGGVWASSALKREAPTETIWTLASGEPVPADFRVIAFPVSGSVGVEDVDRRPLGTLDRAMVNTLDEMMQEKISLRMGATGVGWVRRSDLALDVESGREEALIREWHASMVERVPNLLPQKTWVKIGPKESGSRRNEVQIANDDETFRWVYSTDGKVVAALEVGYKNRMTGATESIRGALGRLAATLVMSVACGVAWWRWRGRSGRKPQLLPKPLSA